MLMRFRSHVGLVGCLALVAMVGCDTDIDPPLKIEGMGALEGLAFFDASEDGIFDPSDGDFALDGLGIAIQERGTGQTIAGATTQSDASGRFSFTGLPAGTHDMLIDTLTVPTGVNICQNPLQVTIFLGETQFTELAGRPGCLITIAAAKELGSGGDFVVVKGIVTSFPGQIDASRTYIEDATAGALIFSGALEGQGINIGDQIEIGANTGEFSNDFEFLNPILRSVFPGAVVDPQPRLVTTAAIAASGADFTDPIQGAFIRVEKAQLIAQFGSGSLNIQNGQIDDGSGATIIRVDDGVADRNSLTTIFTVGTCYNFQGFGANFGGGGQIFLRSTDMADMEVVSCN
ncbi:MAG: hypothetical protein ACE5HT_06340 [Gemmatimonadales bacterium]